jgi:hypothetical protein
MLGRAFWDVKNHYFGIDSANCEKLLFLREGIDGLCQATTQ